MLGPGNPPTLAVLAWQWLSQGDELQQAKGALASLLLMAILGGLALVAWGGWRLQRRRLPDLRGIRHPHPHALPGRLLASALPLSEMCIRDRPVAGMPELARLLGEGLHQTRMRMPQRVHGDAAGKIDILFALLIPQP